MHPDEGLKNLEEIYITFGEFCRVRGQVSETDTRVKIIDRILKEVLGWPEELIKREDRVEKGFIDYMLYSGSAKRAVVVEAKREGIPFNIPIDKINFRYKLNGSIKSNAPLYEAIEQAQYYCVEKSVRYAIVTNGYAWVVFRAYRDDIPWREGSAIVFCSAGDVKRRFMDFWNLLSYEQVLSGSLEPAFATIHPASRKLNRLLEKMHNGDRQLIRNRLHTQLYPIVDQIFGDIAENGQVEILEQCYVHTRILRIMDENLERIITDAIPTFAIHQGVEDLTREKFETALSTAIKDPDGTVFLLLGGIGSGKSTFIKRFFNFVRRDFINTVGCWFYITFLYPPKMDDLELFVYNEISRQIKERYACENLDSPECLLEAFKENIEMMNKTILYTETEEQYARRVSTYLADWVQDTKKHVRALLGLLRKRGKAIVICIDNVDQLSPEYQSNIFLFAQLLAKELQSVTIVALREESFYAASIRKTFTAYNIRNFHISSPDFRNLISTRLGYARRILKKSDQEVRLLLRSGATLERETIDKFLQIMEESLFTRNRNIVRFIECISFGNMREALDMFSKFLYSGNTDVDKMLGIFSQQGSYCVSFHEFAKSIILDDRFYYREASSKILNIFNCGAERNSSHFTGLRLLHYLNDYSGANSPEGQGFVEIPKVLGAFVDIFDNEEDFTLTADRLLRKYLIETDTRATDTIRYSNYFRLTAAGWYYLNYLCKSFAYLDLVYQDTPINNTGKLDEMVDLTNQVDLIVDNFRRREKLELRFQRVSRFVEYLVEEETRERENYCLDAFDNSLTRIIMEPILEQFHREREIIQTKVSRGTEQIERVDFETEAPEIPASLTGNITEEEQ